jgi:queuine tRNA-ribosyltransferase
MQGGLDPAQRRRSAEAIVAADLPGYAIGGLSVGEPAAAMHEMTQVAAELLPADRPRYLMGVGFPDDILAAVAAGVDMFDCVLPTRMGRTGTVLTWDGRLVVKNRTYAEDQTPIDPTCECPTCRGHSRAYLRHLFQAGEVLGLTLATVHNLHFYQNLMSHIGSAIRADRFTEFAAAATSRWRQGEQRRREGTAASVD